jgi:O-methyltransferase involved in polyketide biosynthesis
MLQTRILPRLSGVQETMLWALHERASAAKRPDGILRDDECVRIYDLIDYDFIAHFGQPSGHAPARAAKIDEILRQWLATHPHGQVISLGEGLETQAYRVDNKTMKWLSVDLPDAIDFRERFLPPSERFQHLAMSASDMAWMDHVDDRSGVFIVAQGLLMYFSPETAQGILLAIQQRFAGAEMVFDVVPHSLVQATEQGHQITDTWASPVMPWGLDRNEIKPALRSWMPGLRKISASRYRMPTGRPAIVEDLLDAVLPRRQKLPSLVHIGF